MITVLTLTTSSRWIIWDSSATWNSQKKNKKMKLRIWQSPWCAYAIVHVIPITPFRWHDLLFSPKNCLPRLRGSEMTQTQRPGLIHVKKNHVVLIITEWAKPPLISCSAIRGNAEPEELDNIHHFSCYTQNKQHFQPRRTAGQRYDKNNVTGIKRAPRGP